MSDGATITGSPTIDRAIHWMAGNATTSNILASGQVSTDTRTILDFDAVETPAGDSQQHLLIRERSELQNTVAKLEATVQRAMADIDAKDEEISALKNTSSPPRTDQDPTAAIAALTQQMAVLADMVGTMQRQHEAEKANKQTDQPSQPRTSQPSQPRTNSNSSQARKAKQFSTQPSHPADYSSSSDIEDTDWGAAQDETGAACVSILSRSIRYKTTDPDRISERKDVDGVDSDFKRISDKRPHLIIDSTKTTGKRGSEVGDLARALHSRLADGLEPQPSRQCSVGLSIFALHDNGDPVLQQKNQNALISARGCKTAAEIRHLAQQCHESRRIPAALLTGVASFSDSPLTMAIKREALDEDDRLIRALWDLVILVISMDRSPTLTLGKIDKEWRSISCEDVEDALQQEHRIHERAEKLLRRQPGDKHLSTFSDRVDNMLAAREKINKTIREKFFARLELDNLTLIEISWDNAWDHIIDADLAASRQRSPKNKPKADSSPEDESRPKLPCVLHGDCGHTTSQCRDIAKLGAHPSTVAKLKNNRLCIWDYYDKCGQGQGCKASHNGGSCPFKHLETKELNKANIKNTLMLASPGSRNRALMPAIQDPDDEDPDSAIHMPLVALPFPDEPPIPTGMYLRAMIKDKDDVRVHFPCIVAQNMDSNSDSTDSLYQ